jgi:hypothetical protein
MGRYGTGSAHNPKVAGSNPAPATNEIAGEARCESAGPSACGAENGAARRRSRRRRGAVQPEGHAFPSRSATCSCRCAPVAPVACRSVPRVERVRGVDGALHRNRVGSIARRSQVPVLRRHHLNQQKARWIARPSACWRSNPSAYLYGLGEPDLHRPRRRPYGFAFALCRHAGTLGARGSSDRR